MSPEFIKRWSDLDIEDWNRITMSDATITAKDPDTEDQDSRLDIGEALPIHKGIEGSTAFGWFHEYAY
ncbi:hypothetical protein ABVK25_008649 [Lepraria finkii]|uniref:Uncharacterized protein n=1 Tax=Lepraria finkii TaxID=1340010 RepID=A0ABR4AZZ2_9LECA